MSVERAVHFSCSPSGAAIARPAAAASGVAAVADCACGSHAVQFYEDTAFMVSRVADWLGDGLGRGEACIAIVTAEHQLAIDEALLRRGFDAGALRGSGQLQSLDAHDMLDRLLPGRAPDAGRFAEDIGSRIAEAGAGHAAVRVFCEVVSLLVQQGMMEEALELESLWSRYQSSRPFKLFCAYPLEPFAHDASERFLQDLCDRHSAVIPAESFLALDDGPERNRYVVSLQQKALALRGEAEKRRQEQARVRQRDERLRILGELTNDAFWVNRGGRIIEVNDRCLELLGARYEWQVIGRSPLDFIHPDCHPMVESRIASMLAGFGDVPPMQERIVRLDGTVVECSVTAASYDDDGEPAIQVVLREPQVLPVPGGPSVHSTREHIDPTTGLLNRVGFQAELEAALADLEGELVVLHVDLDRFQLVNDTLGHDRGDELLRLAAQRIARALRDAPGLARSGADEFLVFMVGEDAAREGRRVSAMMVAAFHEPFELGERLVFVTPSIGLATAPQDGTTAGELLRCADLALHAAKKTGGNTAIYYVPSLAADSIARLDLENRLHRALDQDEFRLCYQPIYEVASGRVVGVEALLRWFPIDGPTMMPAEFIPVAEDTGLIQPIGDWVLRTACAQVRDWQQSMPAFAGLRLSVNVSPRQLRDMDPCGSVQRFLTESGLSASQLTLELTESSFLHELEATQRNLERLRAMGVRLSIDDFGTGYSCLAYLRRLPIDELKIDRSFVHQMLRGPSDAALVGAILAMAQALGLDVVAEGVEKWEQLQQLRDRGCRFVQGYGLGRPLLAEDAARFLGTRATLAPAGFTPGAFLLA